MNYEEWLTFYFEGSKSPEKYANEKYVIRVPKLQKIDIGYAIQLDKIQYLHWCLLIGYYHLLSAEKISEVYEFLDYQLLQYIESNPNGEKNFLFFIQDSMIERHFPEHRKEIIQEWIDQKKIELKPQVDKSKDLKQPKLTPFNKPSLNQVQISILFRLLKDSNVFTNKDLDKKGFSKIISQLTGYSENTLRTNFSAKQLIEISANPQDYDTIKTELYAIIEKLERSKNEISK